MFDGRWLPYRDDFYADYSDSHGERFRQFGEDIFDEYLFYEKQN